MTFSLPIELLEDLNSLQIYEKRFKNRSELVSTVLAEYCEKRKKELGKKILNRRRGEKMILKSQDGDIFNLNLCYRIYCDETKILLQLQVGERWDYVIGCYKSSERAEEIFSKIFAKMQDGEKFFVMPRKTNYKKSSN